MEKRLIRMRDGGAVSKKQVLANMGLSQGDLEKVKSDVYAVINLIANAEDIRLTEDILPDVEIHSHDYSGYDRARNTILISRGKIGVGESYAAEAGHFLRNYKTGKLNQKDSESTEELRAEEFFDRAAVIIAREKSQGTALSHLFGKDYTDYSVPKVRNELAQSGRKLRSEHLERVKKGENQSIIRDSKSAIQQFRTHNVFSYADQYSADELLKVKDLYSLPNDRVRKLFFHRKNVSGNGSNKLESVVSGLIIFVSFLFLAFLAANMKFNGFVVSNGLTGASIGAGVFVLIAFFILFVAALFLRIRGILKNN